ncbi:MAG: cytochrome c biogenesis protein CcdA [Chloroflexota bacterium]|nr:cytochrome c biogenesis protein CcdA [Chloroflexota bacterium]
MELSLAAAIFAGVVSFASPCVLPIVPAYLGQLGVVTAATVAAGRGLAGSATTTAATSRWRVLPHAIAFVLGFGLVFVVLGLTLYVGSRALAEYIDAIRLVGGLIVVVLGLNLMGVLRIGVLNRMWRPGTSFGHAPVGGAAARSPFAALALGAIFAVAHTPCVGPTLGAILTLSLSVGAAPEVVALLAAYTVGVGLPFLVLAVALDGSARLTRPLLRHGRTIEIVGGAFVVLIGLAIVFDWLTLLYQTFNFMIPRV